MSLAFKCDACGRYEDGTGLHLPNNVIHSEPVTLSLGKLYLLDFSLEYEIDNHSATAQICSVCRYQLFQMGLKAIVERDFMRGWNAED